MSDQLTLADEIRQHIIDGDFSPGQRLSENALATRFDVSRNTLREAFRVLAEQGLIEHVPHRGVSVASPEIADVIDIYRARRAIEYAALAQGEPTHPAVAEMKDAVATAEERLAAEDWRGVGNANMRFHTAIVAMSDSPRLKRTFHNLSAELRLAFLKIDDPRALHEPFVPRNRTVLTTFTEQGPQEAADALDAYLIRSERSVLGAYARMA